MKLESVGLILSLRPFGERDLIAHIFTREHGVLCGMMRGGAIAKKNRPMVGQCGNASWNARLDSNLGVFHFESSRNLAAPLMSDSDALAYMNSAFALLCALLPERERYPELYDATNRLFAENVPPPGGEGTYLDWEICLLRELGYALDLSRCSNCGRMDNLTQLSSRTGRAACSECAAPYLNQCFPLPLSLDVTGFFLNKIAAEQGGRELPSARKMIDKRQIMCRCAGTQSDESRP